ncbi:SRPBCC family protein [Rubrobacter calidifluminis]|uniref:SRPBCC family protein n=1 Tax=Rubrobacter calidifluminis TaxID=1392640 RepID=UPI00236312A4|nr:SRPBCC family protein [Rubrobacter calidifluminis]
MAHVKATAERTVSAGQQRVYEFISDFQEKRPHILTENFSEYAVEEGGRGAGTVVRYRLRAGRERPFRMRVEEPDPGSTLRESDEGSSFVTTWRLSSQGEDRTRVRVVVEWDGARGVAGIFERIFAPAGIRRVYEGVLERLDEVVREG